MDYDNDDSSSISPIVKMGISFLVGSIVGMLLYAYLQPKIMKWYNAKFSSESNIKTITPATQTQQPATQQTVPTQPTTQTRNYTLLSATDFPGNAITYYEGNFENCQKACDTTPGCVEYTLHKDLGHNCWLKNTKGQNGIVSVNRDTYQLV